MEPSEKSGARHVRPGRCHTNQEPGNAVVTVLPACAPPGRTGGQAAGDEYGGRLNKTCRDDHVPGDTPSDVGITSGRSMTRSMHVQTSIDAYAVCSRGRAARTEDESQVTQNIMVAQVPHLTLEKQACAWNEWPRQLVK